jgi:hypothetical protein
VGDAVIFGPPFSSDAHLRDLAERFLRREPELESVFLHRECDAIIAAQEGGG